MKSALILAVVIGIVAYSDAATTVASGIITVGGAHVFTYTLGATWAATETCTFTADRPLFTRSIAVNANKITSVTLGGAAKLASSTGQTDATGKVLTVTGAGTATGAGGVIVVTVDAAITIAGDQGIYNFVVECSNADAASASFAVPVFGAAATPAVGQPSMATSQIAGAAPGDYTFNFGVNGAVTANAIVTFTASHAIFATSKTAATNLVTSCMERLGTAAAATCDTATQSTFETDSTGKIGKYTLTGDAFTDKMTIALTLKAAAFVNNPATAGLVTLEIDASAGVTNAKSADYPIYAAATTAIFMGATIATDEKSVAPGNMIFTIVPKTTLAVAGKYTITASAAIFKAATPALACGHNGHTSDTADCTAAAVASAGTTLVVTLAQNAATAGYPTVITMSTEAATNGATPGPVTFGLVASAGDTTASTGNHGYTIFNAALTPYFTSAAITSQTAAATPTSLVATFIPQTAVVGGATNKVTITASTAIFTVSATPTVACASTKNRMATTVTCTSASDSTGKILTVTVGGSSGADFFASAVSTVTVSSSLAANAAAGTATTFAFETSADTTGVTAQTGYTTCASSQNVVSGVCVTPSSSAASTNGTTASGTATGTETTVTQVYTFASLTVAAYTGKMKSNCECAYANTVGGATTPLWCTATTSAYTYKSGVTMSSTVAARRAAKVTFVLKVKSSVKTTAQLQTLVASGSTATAFATALAAVNTASNYTAAPGTATVATATFTGGSSSSASTLLPSMLSLVAAIFVAARQ